MVGILREPNYANSLWGKHLYESLVRALREKRIGFCELDSVCPQELDAVFVIAAEREWIESVLVRLNAGGHKPILLCNQSEHLAGCIYSSVSSDLSGSTKEILDHLTREGKTSVALYGINPESVSDLGRVATVQRLNRTHLRCFANEGSLSACFESFFPHVSEFDAVICPNDFAAVSLVRRLPPEERARLTVVSCSASCISDAYRDEIRSLRMNFDRFGRAAVFLFESLAKNPSISELNLKVAWTFAEEREDVPTTVSLPPIESKDKFYRDPELAEMLIAERLLSVSDPTERRILQGLVRGETVELMAEACFLSTGSVKYHIKRLVSMSGARDREHMISLLSCFSDK